MIGNVNWKGLGVYFATGFGYVYVYAIATGNNGNDWYHLIDFGLKSGVFGGCIGFWAAQKFGVGLTNDVYERIGYIATAFAFASLANNVVRIARCHYDKRK